MNLFRSRTVRRIGGSIVLAAGLVGGAFPAITAAAEGDPGTIVIVQSTIPEGPQDFHYTSDVPEYSVFALDDDDDATLPNQVTAADIAAGAYTVYQDDPPVGWAVLGVSCDDPDGGSNTYTNGVLIDLDAGEFITCTVTNSPTSGDVAIHLNASPDDPVAFGFTADWGSFTLNDDGSDADFLWPDMVVSGLQVGAHSLSQSAVDGWSLTGLTCSDPDGGTLTDRTARSVALDVDAGEVIECWFTNEPTAAPPAPPPAQTCNGKAATIVGEAGVVSIRGTQGADVIVALAGDVRVDGRGGDDTICVGSGDNIVNGGAGNDWIDAGAGINTVDGGTGNDAIIAGSGNDTLLGGAGNDDVSGGDGDNLVSTGSGDDDIATGAGNDRIDGGKDYDLCQSGTGIDSVNRCEG